MGIDASNRLGHDLMNGDVSRRADRRHGTHS